MWCVADLNEDYLAKMEDKIDWQFDRRAARRKFSNRKSDFTQKWHLAYLASPTLPRMADETQSQTTLAARIA